MIILLASKGNHILLGTKGDDNPLSVNGLGALLGNAERRFVGQEQFSVICQLVEDPLVGMGIVALVDRVENEVIAPEDVASQA